MDTDINQRLGKLIYQIRHDRGMTQAQFARMLATSQSAVNRIEHGKQNLSLNTLQRISKVLNYEFISLNEFGQPKANVSQDPESGGFVIKLDPS